MDSNKHLIFENVFLYCKKKKFDQSYLYSEAFT